MLILLSFNHYLSILSETLKSCELEHLTSNGVYEKQYRSKGRYCFSYVCPSYLVLNFTISPFVVPKVFIVTTRYQ